MLYSSLIVAVSALAGFAAAQNNNTVVPCCEVPVNNVPESQRNDWCNAQENTCVDLCGGQGDIASNGNECEASSLDYTCKCSNGTDISSSMKTYEQTVPGQMCRFWFDTCINATFGPNGEGNAAQQFNCQQTFDAECGTLKIDESSSASSSSSASPSATRSGSASGSASETAASATGSGAVPAATGAAIANFALGTPVLAGGLLAIFGLAL